MSDTAAGLLTVLALVVVLRVTHVPLGDYMARVYSATTHWRSERLVYRACRIDPDADQTWATYALSVVGFSLASVLFLFGLERLQHLLPLSLGFDPVPSALAWNTAASFVTNTDWQNYSGEATMGHLEQMAGLAVQNFASASVGMAVAVALVRGFARTRTNRVGNFWVDLTRGCVRILLPLSIVATVVLIVAGAVQNLSDPHTVTTLTGATQHIPGGPIASQEAIKELGTNGGGPYNANSAHPFENPNAFTNLLEIVMLLLILVRLLPDRAVPAVHDRGLRRRRGHGPARGDQPGGHRDRAVGTPATDGRRQTLWIPRGCAQRGETRLRGRHTGSRPGEGRRPPDRRRPRRRRLHLRGETSLRRAHRRTRP